MKGFVIKMLVRANILFGILLLFSYLSVFVKPALFWPLSVAGLLYPVFLFINVGFVILWGIRRRKEVVISLVILAAGWPFITRNIQFHRNGKNREEVNVVNHLNRPVKILSFNVRLFNLYKWVDVPDAGREILNFIEKESPDIICLQEFYTRNRGRYSLREINARLSHTRYRYIKYTLKKPGVSSFGIATYSNYPIIHAGAIEFPRTYNVCIYTDLKIGSDTVRVFNGHLQSFRFLKQNYEFIDSLKFEYNAGQVNGLRDILYRMKTAFIKRSEQADTLAAHIRRSPYPVIVCGDFNDAPVSYTYQKVHQGLKDAFVEAGNGFGATYLGKVPSYRIDYIMHDEHFRAVAYHNPGLRLSDHFPVICTLEKK